MVIKPRVRGFVCVTAHPEGCAAHIQQQIDYVKAMGAISDGPKNVLVIGSSTGFGLASRITAAFGCGSKTIGVFFERPSEEDRLATAGWYNTIALTEKARAEGLYARNFNGDAFSTELKDQVIAAIKGGLLSIEEACTSYGLTLEEIATWQRTVERAGIPGLRATCAQKHRDAQEKAQRFGWAA